MLVLKPAIERPQLLLTCSQAVLACDSDLRAHPCELDPSKTLNDVV